MKQCLLQNWMNSGYWSKRDFFIMILTLFWLSTLKKIKRVQSLLPSGCISASGTLLKISFEGILQVQETENRDFPNYCLNVASIGSLCWAETEELHRSLLNWMVWGLNHQTWFFGGVPSSLLKWHNPLIVQGELVKLLFFHCASLSGVMCWGRAR